MKYYFILFYCYNSKIKIKKKKMKYSHNEKKYVYNENKFRSAEEAYKEILGQINTITREWKNQYDTGEKSGENLVSAEFGSWCVELG